MVHWVFLVLAAWAGAAAGALVLAFCVAAKRGDQYIEATQERQHDSESSRMDI